MRQGTPMFFVRIVLLGLGLGGAYLGTLSFQEGSGVDIAVGAGGIAVAVLCFFFLAKALWRVLGCAATFVIVALIVAGLAYFFYTSGLLNIGDKKTAAAEAKQTTAAAKTDGKDDDIQALLDALPELIDKDAKKAPQQAEKAPEGPKKVPIVVGKVSEVSSGDLFKINNVWVRLFGLAAPLPQQTCVNKSGRPYPCGRMVINKLKEIVGQDELFCTVMGADVQGAALSTCIIAKEYDLGVVLIENGLAVALRNITPVYTPYEEEAKAKKIGLWSGSFYMPWDWAQQQEQSKKQAADIKMPTQPVVKKKTGKKGFLDYL